MATEDREVSITLDELRDAALLMNEALRLTELVKFSNSQLALVHAYQLGVVMRATGIARKSIAAVLEFVQIGYEDFAEMKAEHEGERHE